MKCRRVATLRCTLCGSVHVAITSAPHHTPSECNACGQMAAVEILGDFQTELKARRVARLLPFTSAYTGEPCTCGCTDPLLPEEHAGGCPVRTWFTDSFRAAMAAVSGESP